MLDQKITQKAGDNSNQTQVFVIGITEKRVREIFDEKITEAVRECSIEAVDLATKRIADFRNDLIPKLVKENLISSFKDPSVQILLVEAQRSAASTERQEDYSLLSELLVRRIKQGNDRNIRAGVSGAVKIIDEISCEALLGLTVLYAVTHLRPIPLDIKEGLEVLDMCFAKVVYDVLPTGADWMDNLDVLNAIHTSSISKLKPFEEYYTENLPAYISVGIDKSSDDYEKALRIIERTKLPENILCEHELRKGYVRLRISDIENLSSIKIKSIIPTDIAGQSWPAALLMQLSEEQKQAVKEIYALYAPDINLKKGNITEFFKLWDSFNVLREVKDWWNNIPLAFSLTSIGEALAYANARRCDPTLPKIF